MIIEFNKERIFHRRTRNNSVLIIITSKVPAITMSCFADGDSSCQSYIAEFLSIFPTFILASTSFRAFIECPTYSKAFVAILPAFVKMRF
jgi:hypothetical protein